MDQSEIIKALTDARSRPDLDLMKAWTQSASAIQGITAYDLEAPAKKLYPVITPIRNRVPRLTGGLGIQANYRAVTGINTTGLSAGVSGGNRGGVITSTSSNNIAIFAGLGLEDYVTFEADYAAKSFDDVKSLAVEGLLRSLMIQEERIDVAGLGTWKIGGAGAPTINSTAFVVGTTGVTTASYGVYVVGLTLDGYLNSTVTAGLPNAVTRTNADSTTDTYGGGNGSLSTQAGITIAATASLQVSCSALPGAVAYAWFWGATGSETLGAITTINSLIINGTATAQGGAQNATAVTADNSQNTLVWDGLLSQVYKSGSGSYVSFQATGTPGVGTPLTSDGAGGITEIDTALQSFWDKYRLSPTDMYVNSQEAKNITKKVLNATTSAAQRFVFDAKQGVIAGGTLVASYLNKFGLNGAAEIPIHLHPNVPPGTILFYTDVLPYPLSNVPQVLRKLCRRDYYQMEWPLRTRKYEYGVYMDGVLQNYFPPAFGVMSNIANG